MFEALRIRHGSRTVGLREAFAAEKGLRYQTYVKMLLHQALDSEEKTSGRR
jgi:predicted DNA binding CopG/RHH family protein